MAGPDEGDPEEMVNSLVRRRSRELAKQVRRFGDNGEPPAGRSGETNATHP